ncbi:MAG: response regulator, partial [Fibrobacter sp.]|nr:response regulator [Fibrobacter sp.]
MAHKVLFIDDEEVLLDSIQILLGNELYTVETTTVASVALEKLEKDCFAVVVSDMRMPGMDGNEFLEKAQKISPDSVYIVLSAFADMDSVMTAVNERHVWQYITKPWHGSDLRVTIRNALEIYEHRKEKKELMILLEEKNVQLNVLNNTLEKLVEERTQRLLLKSEILQMLVEDADINKILKKLCEVIADLFMVKSVYVNVPFLKVLVSNGPQELTESLTELMEKCHKGKCVALKETEFALPLMKKNRFLGIMLVENDSALDSDVFTNEASGFISITILCLMQAWDLYKMDELLKELN